MKIKTKDDRRVRIQLRQRKRIAGTTERPRLSVFRSVDAHLRAGDRRPERQDAGVGVERRAGAEGRVRQGRRAAATSRAPRRSARRSPSGRSKRASSASCSTAAGSCITAAFAPWRTPRAKQVWSSEHMRTRERIDPSQLDIKDTVVSINRVTKVVKGGKNLSFSALVVVGDGHGVVGFGIGKAKEVPSAIKKGIEAAKKNLIRVPLAGHDDSAPDRRQLRRRQRAAEAGAGRHRHHRRRRGARGRRGGRHHQHPDQVARIGEPAQRRARDDRRARSAEGSGARSRGCAARSSRSSSSAGA